MKKRQLGKSAIEVAPLMLGGNVFGWTADEATSFKILDAFVDAGLNFIDTADTYSTWVPGHQGGESETIIGNWFKQQRQARQGCDRHQSGSGNSRAGQRAEQSMDHAAGGSVAQEIADGPY